MRIYKLDKVSDSVASAFAKLIPQLADDLKVPSKELLQAIVDANGSYIFVAEEDGKILGSTTLIICMIPTGRKARIEDVVVDSDARGKGVASKLMEAAINLAEKEGIEKLDLSSSSFRESAHALYYKLGFEKRDTSVFRLVIKHKED